MYFHICKHMAYSPGAQLEVTLRAIVCEKPFDLRMDSRTDPPRNPGEVLIRIRRVGLCGTDYHIYAGMHPYLEYPRVIGHELAGEVVEAASLSAFRPGQLVTVNPYLSCGKCIACRKERQNCCASLRVLGVHTDGGMCDFLAVPEHSVVDATGLSFDQAAMVEFLSIGAHAVRRASLRNTDGVLVVGAGPIGIAVALFARFAGAAVTLMDISRSRLDYARTRLDQQSIVGVSESAKRELSEITHGEMFDCVFDATGSITAMRAGLDYVAHGGKYVLVSVVKDELSFPDPEFHKRETTLLASRNALREDFEQVIQHIERGRIATQALHTHSFPATDAQQRIPELFAEKASVLKAIVTF